MTMADEQVTISGVQMHLLKNRLTVIKIGAQLLERQLRRLDVDGESLAERVRALHDEITIVEAILRDIERGAETRAPFQPLEAERQPRSN